MLHALIAIVMQVCIAYFFGWWVGAAAGMWLFIGREFAQAEYRLIEHYYGGLRANMPRLAPLRDRRAWDQKAVLDFVLPTVAVIALAYAKTLPALPFGL